MRVTILVTGPWDGGRDGPAVTPRPRHCLLCCGHVAEALTSACDTGHRRIHHQEMGTQTVFSENPAQETGICTSISLSLSCGVSGPAPHTRTQGM